MKIGVDLNASSRLADLAVAISLLPTASGSRHSPPATPPPSHFPTLPSSRRKSEEADHFLLFFAAVFPVAAGFVGWAVAGGLFVAATLTLARITS